MRAVFWTVIAAAVASSVVACATDVPDTSEPAAANDAARLVEASEELKGKGVAYFLAEGTAEEARVTLYDLGKNVIGSGNVERMNDPETVDLHWKGVHWESETAHDAEIVKRDGLLVTSEDQDAEFESALDVLEIALQQADLPSRLAQAQACMKGGGGCSRTKCCGGYTCHKYSFISKSKLVCNSHNICTHVYQKATMKLCKKK